MLPTSSVAAALSTAHTGVAASFPNCAAVATVDIAAGIAHVIVASVILTASIAVDAAHIAASTPTATATASAPAPATATAAAVSSASSVATLFTVLPPAASAAVVAPSTLAKASSASSPSLCFFYCSACLCIPFDH